MAIKEALPPDCPGTGVPPSFPRTFLSTNALPWHHQGPCRAWLLQPPIKIAREGESDQAGPTEAAGEQLLVLRAKKRWGWDGLEAWLVHPCAGGGGVDGLEAGDKESQGCCTQYSLGNGAEVI